MSKKRKIINTIKVFLILTILSVGFYPTISDAWNRYVASTTVSSYRNIVEVTEDDTLDTAIADAIKYNNDLYNSNIDIGDYTQISGDELFSDELYENLLDINSDGIMGWINIPKINVELPVYHYTNDDVLSKGIGHLYGTSLPIGGINSHSVISGHRGLPTAKLFTDIDQLIIGDSFQINILGKTLYYKIFDINTVLPNDIESLKIQEGKDLCTLVTCTPYGVNSHRLLITGERVEDSNTTIAKSPIKTIQKTIQTPWIVFVAVIFVLLIALFALIYIWTRKTTDANED